MTHAQTRSRFSTLFLRFISHGTDDAQVEKPGIFSPVHLSGYMLTA